MPVVTTVRSWMDQRSEFPRTLESIEECHPYPVARGLTVQNLKDRHYAMAYGVVFDGVEEPQIVVFHPDEPHKPMDIVFHKGDTILSAPDCHPIRWGH